MDTLTVESTCDATAGMYCLQGQSIAQSGSCGAVPLCYSPWGIENYASVGACLCTNDRADFDRPGSVFAKKCSSAGPQFCEWNRNPSDGGVCQDMNYSSITGLAPCANNNGQEKNDLDDDIHAGKPTYCRCKDTLCSPTAGAYCLETATHGYCDHIPFCKETTGLTANEFYQSDSCRCGVGQAGDSTIPASSRWPSLSRANPRTVCGSREPYCTVLPGYREGSCSTMPLCEHTDGATPNAESCRCGLGHLLPNGNTDVGTGGPDPNVPTNYCQEATNGLVCDAETALCSYPTCENQDGTVPNQLNLGGQCRCGTKTMCTFMSVASGTEPFCFGHMNGGSGHCDKIQACEIQDGVTANSPNPRPNIILSENVQYMTPFCLCSQSGNENATCTGDTGFV